MMAWPDLLAKLRAIETLFNGRKAEVFLEPPASAAELEGCRTALGVSLPTDYREFLRHAGGALLYPFWSGGDGGFALFSAEQLSAANETAYEIMLEEIPPGERPFFIFGVLAGIGDHLALDADGAVWWISHEGGIGEEAGRKRLAGSLEEFLLTLASRKGDPWWLNGFGRGRAGDGT